MDQKVNAGTLEDVIVKILCLFIDATLICWPLYGLEYSHTQKETV
jgi:hypothetical protein